MLIVHVHVHVTPASVDAFIAATRENARSSVREPGIVRFDVVRQDDDHGGVTVSDAGFVVLSRVEASIAEQLRTRAGFAVVAECGPAGREIVVGGPGTTVDCTVTATGNPADAARIVGTVTDDAGTVAF